MYKSSYYVMEIVDTFTLDVQELIDITEELKLSNFELTRSEYFSKNQRKLMTPELRQKVKERDKFTCQCCGKYMPDEVGLHIDHIIPVSKGGKTVLNNLQVLCDKCNLGKGNR